MGATRSQGVCPELGDKHSQVAGDAHGAPTSDEDGQTIQWVCSGPAEAIPALVHVETEAASCNHVGAWGRAVAVSTMLQDGGRGLQEIRVNI